MGHDVFISYSHAADGMFAPRLQEGLQRFARPWYKRRVLSVFRDETGLSANPGLWTSISAALDECDYFVLLASPEAARSVWVNREVEYWLANKDASKILPVLTNGTWSWSEAAGTFDPASTAVPPALLDAFTEEPRHLDMCWAQTETQLDLRSGRFRNQIAELAAPVHGVPKDELEGTDIRLHRRAIRLAWTGALTLVLLTLFSVGATVAALRSADTARQQQERADVARTEADRQAGIASSKSAEADRERDAATLSAIDAQSQRAVAQASAEDAQDQKEVADDQRRLAEHNEDVANEQTKAADESARVAAERKVEADQSAEQAAANATRAQRNADEAAAQKATAVANAELATDQRNVATRNAETARLAQVAADQSAAESEALRQEAVAQAGKLAEALDRSAQLAEANAEQASANFALALAAKEDNRRLEEQNGDLLAYRFGNLARAEQDKGNFDRAILLAGEAVAAARTEAGATAAQGALFSSLSAAEDVIGYVPGDGFVSFTVEGQAFGAATADDVVAIGDLADPADARLVDLGHGADPAFRGVARVQPAAGGTRLVVEELFQDGTGPVTSRVSVVDRSTGVVLFTSGPGSGFSLSPDGRRLAIDEGDVVVLVNATTGTVHTTWMGSLASSVRPVSQDPASPAAAHLDFSADGHHLLGFAAGQWVLWQAKAPFATVVLFTPTSAPSYAAIGGRSVITVDGPAVTRYDLTDVSVVAEAQLPANPVQVGFSNDATEAATVNDDGSLSLADLRSLPSVETSAWDLPAPCQCTVTVSPGGGQAIAGSRTSAGVALDGHVIGEWNDQPFVFRDGALVAKTWSGYDLATAYEAPACEATRSPELALCRGGGKVTLVELYVLWDGGLNWTYPGTPIELAAPRVHSAQVAPDEETVLALTLDGRLLALADDRGGLASADRTLPGSVLDVSRDGRYLRYVDQTDATSHVVDLSTGADVAIQTVPLDEFSWFERTSSELRDGPSPVLLESMIVTTFNQETFAFEFETVSHLYDASTGALIASVPGSGRLSGDRRSLVVVDQPLDLSGQPVGDATVSVVDLATMSTVSTFELAPTLAPIGAVDGNATLATMTAEDGRGLRVLDVRRGADVSLLPTGGTPQSATFSPAGDRLAVLSDVGSPSAPESELAVYDTATWEPIAVQRLDACSSDLVFNADGSMLVVGRHYLDTIRFDEVITLDGCGPSRVSPDGSSFTLVDGEVVHVVAADLAAVRTRACRLAARNLTADEWARFVPGTTPHATCPS